MIDIYCKKNHKNEDVLCDECQELLDYAHKRLTYCKFGDEKSTCQKCPIHCYKKDMRDRVRKVMKFSGPRVLIYRPIEFIKHTLDI